MFTVVTGYCGVAIGVRSCLSFFSLRKSEPVVLPTSACIF